MTLVDTGCRPAVFVVAALHIGRVARPHDDVSVLSNVREATRVAQPRQRDAAAAGASGRCAACWCRDVVYQSHVEHWICEIEPNGIWRHGGVDGGADTRTGSG